MDPDENRREQLACAQVILEADDKSEEYKQAAARMAVLVVALDEWLSSGGSLPEEWKNPGPFRPGV